MSRKLKQIGFSLIELLIVITVGTILISTALPSMIDTIKNGRLVALNNELVSDLALARSTAITRGNHATLCASNFAGNQCRRNARSWDNGWIVFDDIDNDGRVDTGESKIAVNLLTTDQIKISADNSRVSYDAEGFAFGSSIEFVFCDDRGDSKKRGLIVSDSGRSRPIKEDVVSGSCNG